MNKAQLVEHMVKDVNLDSFGKKEANASLEAFIGAVAKVLKKGDKLTLIGFGTFSVSKRKARKGRNPQTGAVIQIKAKKVAKFKAGKDLNSKL
ncbi:MAG: HU family DNA-binding protein [Phycisphaerales bacterium]|nr:HU family DNA-binding protein [Phycisphaerales bacterium]